MRGPGPDDDDVVTMLMTRVVAARHARHEARAQRIREALNITDELDGETVFL
jgi:hypothetical protein